MKNLSKIIHFIEMFLTDVLKKHINGSFCVVFPFLGNDIGYISAKRLTLQFKLKDECYE